MALISQLPKEADFHADVRRKTYGRLGRLNKYLGRLRANRWPFSEQVADWDEWKSLKREVDIAGALDRRLQRREQWLGAARIVAVSEIVASLLAAGAYRLSLFADSLGAVATVTVAIGLGVSGIGILVAELQGQAIRAAEDT